MGQAIVNFAREQGIELLKAGSFRALPGQGVTAEVQGALIRVGKQVFLEKKGVQLKPEMAAEAERLEHDGKTIVWVSRDNVVLGIIALMDEPKADAQRAIQQLQSMKINVIMITGDNKTTAKAIAEKTGIQTVSAGILPAGKSEEIMRLRAAGKVVADRGISASRLM